MLPRLAPNLQQSSCLRHLSAGMRGLSSTQRLYTARPSGRSRFPKEDWQVLGTTSREGGVWPTTAGGLLRRRGTGGRWRLEGGERAPAKAAASGETSTFPESGGRAGAVLGTGERQEAAPEAASVLGIEGLGNRGRAGGMMRRLKPDGRVLNLGGMGTEMAVAGTLSYRAGQGRAGSKRGALAFSTLTAKTPRRHWR